MIIVVILGLGLTVILANLGGQIRKRSSIQIYPLQIFACCFLLLTIVMWHWSFSRTQNVNWTLPLFILNVIPAVALALGAQVISIDINSSKSPQQQYFENCGYIYTILASVPVITVITETFVPESLTISTEILARSNILRLSAGCIMASLAIIRKPTYHWFSLMLLYILVTCSTSVAIFNLNF
jgi:hypothetical protein